MNMKRILFLLVAAFILFGFQTKAQLGVHIGYNFSKVDGAEPVLPTLSEKYLTSLSGGIFFDKGLISLLDIRLGLMYSPKGTRFVNGDSYTKTTINYLEVPLQAKIKVGPIYALGGVYGAMALNGKVKDHYMNGVLFIGADKDLDFQNDNYKKVDYGLKFGVGFQYGLGPIHIFAQGDYSFGLMNIHDADGAEWKNNTIGVSAGVLIGF